MEECDLNKILSRKGYGIQSSVKSSFSRSVASSFGDSRKSINLELDSSHESIREGAVQVGYSGIAVIRIKFYRKRLADYSRANCEKYIIDGLVYAGLIRDDSEKEIRLIDEGQVKVETQEEERVELSIEYPEVDYENLWVPKTKFGNSGA